jgi:hypothetical protein
MYDGDMNSILESTKAKNTFLMEENKDLKKRIREVMQTETDYQDTVVVLKVD